ncbi:MAG: OmpA family protein [Bacteroidales bacterium]|nr:OmpA family protein [Bacteroidales bacterium]
MKKIALLFASLALSVSALAQQSEAQSKWVPTHEFFISGFGGFSNLNYKIDPNFGFPGNGKPVFNITDALGGGGGFGYTVHFNDWIGLTTGVEYALYRGGFSLSNNPWIFYSLSNNDKDLLVLSYDSFNHGNMDDKRDLTLMETQTVHSIQIPVMIQFMAPLNARKSNHFYAAIGARIGFNIAGNFNRSFNAFQLKSQGIETSGTLGYTSIDQQSLQETFSPNGPYANNGGWPGGWTSEPTPTQGPEYYTGDQLNDLQKLEGILTNGEDLSPGEDEDGFPTNGDEKLKEDYEDYKGLVDLDGNKKGKLNLNLINVLASAELGFRWGLGNGWGLYTGIYFDYGFMPLVAAGNDKLLTSKLKEDVGGGGKTVESLSFTQGSLLEASHDYAKISVATDENPDIPRPQVAVDPHTANIANKVTNIGAGLKLRLAFGKVKKAPVAPIIEYRTDTLEKIIYVRDTVQNTVVVKDTVTVEKTNTVIVRDTVTIIKEVPVEIQKTMMELSNTMFDFDKSVIKEVAKEPLNKVVKWLQENPELKVEISGHTDNKGSRAYNKRLSEARAKAVYDYFVEHGVNKFRLAYAGYGFDKPIATNDTEEGRQLNRRVELNIVE